MSQRQPRSADTASLDEWPVDGLHFGGLRVGPMIVSESESG